MISKIVRSNRHTITLPDWYKNFYMFPLIFYTYFVRDWFQAAHRLGSGGTLRSPGLDLFYKSGHSLLPAFPQFISSQVRVLAVVMLEHTPPHLSLTKGSLLPFHWHVTFFQNLTLKMFPTLILAPDVCSHVPRSITWAKDMQTYSFF